MSTITENQLDKFVQETNASRVDEELLERFEKLTGQKPHRYLRRGIVFCHRDLELILDKYEHGLPFYLFTGRGPSSESLHIGHSIPFEFTKWLQEVFNASLIIMLTDDMKLLHSQTLTVASVRRFTNNNAKDILAFNFDPKKTFMFSNLDFVGGAFYENIIRIARHISVKSIKVALGFTDDDNVGMFYCCSTQSAGTFATSFPHILGSDQNKLKDMSCLIACSYDIDGYFSEVRKHAPKLGYHAPAFLYSSLLPALQGAETKMSASVPLSAVFLTDDEDMVREKLALAFPTQSTDEMEEAGNVETLIQYLRFFVESDSELERLESGYHATKVTKEELRGSLLESLMVLLNRFQKSRGKMTDEDLKDYMASRLLA